VLALIGLDAASPAIVEELLAEDRLPHLRAFRASGTGLALETPALHFPAGVYPTLWSGVPLAQHGIHFPFMWSAPDQRVRFHSSFPYPAAMWERLAQSRATCVVLDAYESPTPKAIDGLYLRGWQFRNRVVLQPAGSPKGALRHWERRFGRAVRAEEVFGLPDERRLRRLASRLVAAPRRIADLAVAAVREVRPDLLVVSMPAVHIAGHQFWNPSAVLEDARPELGAELRSALRRVYVEADAAIGRIVDALPASADVIVFSALGMGPETSRQDVLGSLLSAVLDGAREERGPGRAWDFRGRVPASLRARVADALPDSVAISLTAALELRGVDWSRTRAFALPSDTVGYVRLNLRGRERDGVVEAGEADALIEEIDAGLRTFVLPSGALAVTAVDRVVNVVPNGPGSALLPDLVVRWSAEPARPNEVLTSRSFGAVQRKGVGSGRSGNHTADAWALVLPGAAKLSTGSDRANIIDLAATALGRFGLDHAGVELLERP
jgi:predicted AlkP superfamily phosphohydrolase/phosphomutase